MIQLQSMPALLQVSWQKVCKLKSGFIHHGRDALLHLGGRFGLNITAEKRAERVIYNSRGEIIGPAADVLDDGSVGGQGSERPSGHFPPHQIVLTSHKISFPPGVMFQLGPPRTNPDLSENDEVAQ